MSKLFDFLTDLAANPKQQQAFANEPDAVMDALELSQSERAVLKSGNSVQIAATFADKHFQAAFTIIDPTPDPLPDSEPPDSEPPDSEPPDSEPSEEAKLLALVV